MRIEEAKKLAGKLIGGLEYQEIKDSPAIPYYTEWKQFDKYDPAGTANIMEIRMPEECGWDPLYNWDEAGSLNETDEIMLFRPDENRLLAMHFLGLRTAREIAIPEGTKKSLVIAIVGAMDSAVVEGHHLRLIIEKDTRADITIIEHNKGKAAMTTSLEIIARRNTHTSINHIVIPNRKSPSASILRAKVGSNTRLSIRGLYVGGLMHRSQIELMTVGDNTDINYIAGAYGFDNTKLDLVITAFISSSNTDFVFRGIGMADDESYVALRANGIIGRGTKASGVDIDGAIYNFGDKSKAIVSPVLHINTNNVKYAKHSKAVISLNQDTLFYMGTRGLNPAETKVLLRDAILGGIIGVSKKCLRALVFGE